MIKVHLPKGLWNTNGGMEFPLVMATVALVVGLVGPGLYSLDGGLGLSLPQPAAFVIAIVVALLGVGASLWPVPSGQKGAQHRPM